MAASPKKILIIDDEIDASGYLKEYFQAKGLEAATASDGEGGLKLLASFQPDLVILDMRLGQGISGMEVLRRGKAAKSKARFIIVTGVDDQNVTELARGLGATDYITKPYSLSDLERVVLARLK